jgi:hypothetical protein
MQTLAAVEAELSNAAESPLLMQRIAARRQRLY